MKTPEDEAFDDLARRQGAWGGGFQAKRAMAANKQHWSDCAVHNAPAYPAGECDCGVPQEPVAWCIKYGGVLLYAEGSLSKKEVEGNFARNFNEGLSEIIPFYTIQPKREWVGLTDEELADCLDMSIQKICRAIEAKLKEKNG